METGDVLRPGAADASVRAARPADAAAVGGVQARAMRSAWGDLLDPAALDALTPQALAPVWEDAIRTAPSARYAVLVACSGATVVGFAAVRPAGDPDAGEDDGELAVLLVDPLHQRAGHGSRLLSAAVARLRDAGVTRLLAWSPEPDTARTGFLVSAGMVLDGARRTYETDDGRPVSEVRLTAALAEG